jgi:hypothetical protein
VRRHETAYWQGFNGYYRAIQSRPGFTLHVERDNTRIDDSNREAHRELARVGLMEPIHAFAPGRESHDLQ